MCNVRRRWSGLLAAIGLWAIGLDARAGSFVERLSPPSLVRGKTTRLTLVGSELRGATGLWTSPDGKDIEAKLVGSSGDDRACFDVRVDRDAPLGLYGLRLATRSGLSNVKLFL